LRVAVFNAETALARALNQDYPRAGGGSYALIREALHASDGTLTVRLDLLSAPRRTRAIAALYPSSTPPLPATRFVLSHEVKDHPGTA